jgi:hypothetical protein
MVKKLCKPKTRSMVMGGAFLLGQCNFRIMRVNLIELIKKNDLSHDIN